MTDNVDLDSFSQEDYLKIKNLSLSNAIAYNEAKDNGSSLLKAKECAKTDKRLAYMAKIIAAHKAKFATDCVNRLSGLKNAVAYSEDPIEGYMAAARIYTIIASAYSSASAAMLEVAMLEKVVEDPTARNKSLELAE